MSGSVEGGLKAAKTNKEKYGSDFYAKIGAKGGKLGKTGGFFADKELARRAGAKGGKVSKRGKTKNLTNVTHKVVPHPSAGTVDTTMAVKTYHVPASSKLDDEMSQSKKPNLLTRLFKKER